MSVSTVNLLLWIPFSAVFALCAIFFCKSGYKRGVISALISLGATVASAVVSLLLANLIAMPIAPLLSDIVPKPASGGFEDVLFTSLVGGLIEGFVALLLFSILMLILTLVLKRVAKKLEKRDSPEESKAKKWGGLGVRLADAVIFAVLLLLPIYGTVSAYAPTACTLVEIDGGRENTELLSLLRAAEGHPCVYLAKPAPVSAVYNGLTTVDFNDESVSIPAVLSVVQETYERGESLIEDMADNTVDRDEVVEYIDFLNEEVIESDWAFAIVQEILNVGKAELSHIDDGQYQNTEEIYLWRSLLTELSLSQDSFRENGSAALDFLSYIFSNFSSEDFELSGDESYELVREKGLFLQLGRLANATDETVIIKKCLYQSLAARYTTNDSAVAEFMKEFPEKPITDPALLEKEGEALIMLMSRDRVGALLTAPGIGADAFERVAPHIDTLEMFSCEGLLVGEEKIDYLMNDEGFKERLCDFLHLCENTPTVGNTIFSAYLPAIRGLILSGEDFYLHTFFTKDAPDSLKTALRLVSEEYFLAGAPNADAARATFSLATAFGETMVGTENVSGEYDLATECLSFLCRFINTAYNNSADLSAYVSKGAVRSYVRSELSCSILEYIIKNEGNDPYGLSPLMNQGFKEELSKLLSDVQEEMANENTGYITINEYNSKTGNMETKNIAIKDITDEQLEAFGITRAELLAQNLTEDQITKRLDILKAFWGI